jgi:hypothetical protein
MTTAAITKSIRQKVLPPLKPTTITLETLCKVAQSEIDAMSFKELDGFVDLGIHCIALNQAGIIRARQAMKPALIRIQHFVSTNSPSTTCRPASTFRSSTRSAMCAALRY